jgi:hypothetical protein
MNDEQPQGLSAEELDSEGATGLPDKEVVSILDLNADINLAIDAAAPIDLAVAANANVAAPIDAAVGANVLSVDSTAQALSHQGALINQGINADASAHATQDSALDQSNDGGGTVAPADATATPADATTTALPDPGATTGDVAGTVGDTTGALGDAAGGAVGDTTGAVGGAVGDTTGAVGGAVGGATSGGLLDGNLLNVDVNVDANADIAAPINGAVAANANVAAPIDGAVGANVGSIGSDAVAVSQQDAIINQDITGSADATSDQTSDINQ